METTFYFFGCVENIMSEITCNSSTPFTSSKRNGKIITVLNILRFVERERRKKTSGILNIFFLKKTLLMYKIVKCISTQSIMCKNKQCAGSLEGEQEEE